jgi:hypothetical protein
MTTKTKNKQKLKDGNFVSSLSPEQLAYYNTITDPNQRQQFETELTKQSTEQSTEQSSGSNLTSSLSGNLGLIGMIEGVAGELAGETDKYGQSDTQVQAFLDEIGNIGSNFDNANARAADGDYLGAIGAILNPGFSEAWFDDAKAEEERKKEQNALLRSTGQLKSEQQRFKKGGEVKTDGKERDTGKLNLSEEEIEAKYGKEEGVKPLYTSEEIINGMLKSGYTPYPEKRNDRLQKDYELSESEKVLYDAFETKDIQDYIVKELGLELDDFGVDNVYGKETGEIMARLVNQKNSEKPLEPKDIELPNQEPSPTIKNKKNIDKVLYYGPNGQIYQFDPNTYEMKGAQKNFTRSAERETLQYATEVAKMDYNEAKKLLETEQGRQQLVSQFNKKQGYSDDLVRAYASQGSFPVYENGKLKGVERIYDDQGELVLDDPTKLNYAEGGTVKGAGTGKSDSIEAKLNPGDFVIPTDSPVSKNALNTIMNVLDLNHKADTKSGSQDVMISNNEKVIPKDKVQAADTLLKRMGYRNGLKDAAPNSEYDFEYQFLT